MAIYFGEKLKQLRREKNITQEALAAFLGITSQAVSKWERGENYPDLIIIPALANYFDVTTDTILGMDKAKDNERLEKYCEEYRCEFRKGNVEKCIAIMRKAAKEFPGNYTLVIMLMEALSGTREGYKNHESEVITLGERILENCNDDSIRMKAKNIIMHSMIYNGQKEEAEKLAETMPNVRDTKQWARAILTTSELYTVNERVAAAKENIQAWTSHLASFITRTITNSDENSTDSTRLTIKEDIENAIHSYKTVISLFELIYPDGDYGFYAKELCYMYGRIGVHYSQLGDDKNSLKNLKSSYKLAKAFDELPDKVVHTSPLVKGLIFDMNRTRKSKSESLCEEVRRCYFINERLDDRIVMLPEWEEMLQELDAYIASQASL